MAEKTSADPFSKASGVAHWEEELARAVADAKNALARIDHAKKMLARLNTSRSTRTSGTPERKP